MRTRTKVVVGTAATLLALAGLGGSGVGALVGLEVGGPGGGGGNTTTTVSTKHVTTTERVDLEPAAPPACDFPGTDPELVDETSVALEPVISTSTSFGPTTIYVGEDQQTPFFVEPGTTNVDTLTTYETIVTQYFQATAAGEACTVVAAAARFTG